MFPSLRLFARCYFALLIATVALAGCDRAGVEGQPTEDVSAATAPPSVVTDNSARAAEQMHPRVKMSTSLGDIVVRLDGEKAVLTMNNFLQYANEGFYDGTVFHDVNAGYVVLGGGYTEDLSPKPTRLQVRNEADNGLKNVRGTIAMARDPATIDSGASMFFINLADNAYLDHRDGTPEGYGYCVFGKVIEGMDVADRIGKLQVRESQAKDGKPLPRVPAEPVVIRSVRVIP